MTKPIILLLLIMIPVQGIIYAMPVPSEGSQEKPVPVYGGGEEGDFGLYCLIGFSSCISIMAILSWDNDELVRSIGLLFLGSTVLLYTLVERECKVHPPDQDAIKKENEEEIDG